jgi:hypothetical protein
LINVCDTGKPVLTKGLQEGRAAAFALGVTHGSAIGVPRNAAIGAEGMDYGRKLNRAAAVWMAAGVA